MGFSICYKTSVVALTFLKFEPSSERFTLRLCETPRSPPAPDSVGIGNCKQLFSSLLAFTTHKIATRSTHIISAEHVAFFWVVNATRNEKSCLQFLIPTAVFHMLLRQCETHSQCVSLAPPREPLKLYFLHSIVFHIALIWYIDEWTLIDWGVQTSWI